jgi:hypothetical protein
MAGIGATYPTLLDVAKQLDPDGKAAKVAEILAQENTILADLPMIEGNLPGGHRVSIRTGLPTVYWRNVNSGVQPSKSTTAQVDEQCGMLEAWSSVDKDAAEFGGNAAGYRANEAKGFLEAMNQEFAQTFFYGNSSSAPEEFNGLAIRYSAISGATNAQNIITGSGSQSDNSSIWLVGYSADTVHGIYPKGSKAGIDHMDFGLVPESNAGGTAGNNMLVYKERYQLKVGVVVKDWRYIVRIPNIDISNLVAKSSAADLIELMIKATHRIPNLSNCKPVFYMNRSVFQMLDIQRRDDVIAGGGLVFENVDGKRQSSFRGIPVKICDQLTEAEAAVS